MKRAQPRHFTQFKEEYQKHNKNLKNPSTCTMAVIGTDKTFGDETVSSATSYFTIICLGRDWSHMYVMLSGTNPASSLSVHTSTNACFHCLLLQGLKT